MTWCATFLFFIFVFAIGAVGLAQLMDVVGHPLPWSIWTLATAVLVAALGAASWAASQHHRSEDSVRNWDISCAALDLETSSLALMLWALDQEGPQALPAESTMWTVKWRADEAGMHTEMLYVCDVSNTVLRKWKFGDCPVGLRHRPWPDGPTPVWSNRGKAAVLRAVVPHMTAHKRLALRAVVGVACADEDSKVA